MQQRKRTYLTHGLSNSIIKINNYIINMEYTYISPPFSAKQKLGLAGGLYLGYFMFTVYDKNEVTVDGA